MKTNKPYGIETGVKVRLTNGRLVDVGVSKRNLLRDVGALTTGWNKIDGKSRAVVVRREDGAS